MHSRIEQQVMGSVAVIYSARKLYGATALKLYALAISAAALWQLTWVHKVFANFSAVEHAGWGAVTEYVTYAFLHTHLPVQVAVIVAAAAALSLLADAIRSLLQPRTLLLPR